MNALNAYNKLNANVAGLKKASEKLSSGYRINRAGDDAAGLAISEKMRSQIRGLNQAKRNAQDGISMIQTFEGAAQETHTILQRMKELATESANGTYDDPTDRAAIQLEFDQLNDELNQLADTDFNGTIVLNGGQMSDGLKAVDGKFNYANYKRDPKQLSASDVNVVDYQKFDDVTGVSKGVTKADDFWNAINSSWDRSDASTANDGPDSIDVTFQYDATGGASKDKFWKVVSATGGADVDKILASSTNNGGFDIGVTGATDYVKVVADSTKLVTGDTITITLKNPAASKAAPTHGGAEVLDSSTFVEGTKATAIKLSDANLGVSIEAAATDADTTAATDALFKTLNGATFEVKYDGNASTATDSKYKIIATDPNGDEKTILNDAAFKKLSITSEGKNYDFGVKFGTDGNINIGLLNDDGTDVGTALVKLSVKPDAAAATQDSTGSITYKIGIEHGKFDTSAKPEAFVKAPQNAEVSKSNSFENSTARMTYTDNLTLQVGSRTKDAVNFTFNYNSDGSADMGNLKANLNLSSRADGLNTANLSLANAEDANYAIDQIDKAINKTSMVRASFGAIQNRLDYKIENLTTTSENLTEAESNIRDTDMANEMLNYTKFNILQQAAQSMLAQANQQPQSILQLLG